MKLAYRKSQPHFNIFVRFRNFIQKGIKILSKRKLWVVLSALVVAISGVAAGVMVSESNAQDGVFVPIIMYHSLSRDESRWNDYVLSPVEFEKDLIYLKQNGYTTIFVSDLIAYVYDGAQLPPKPVIITFDDGHLNTYTTALEVLERHQMKAVVSFTGDFCDRAVEENDANPEYAYMTWIDVKNIAKSEYVEIGNHSYSFHSNTYRMGAAALPGESYEEYRSVLIADTMRLHSTLQKVGITPSVYTFPYGFYSEDSNRILKICGYQASMITAEKPNYITDEESLFGLCRYNRPAYISTDDFMTKALNK